MTLLRTALGALRALAHAVAETRHERTRARAQAMKAEADAAYQKWISSDRHHQLGDGDTP